MTVNALPIGESSGYYHTLGEEKEYPLPFKASAYFDYTDCDLYEMTEDEVADLPHTRYLMTDAAFQEWESSRRVVGAEIDIATCEISGWYTCYFDPYGANPALPEELQQVYDFDRFVRSPESRGWIYEHDLPFALQQALFVRTRHWPKDPCVVDSKEERLSQEIPPWLHKGEPDWRTWTRVFFLPKLWRQHRDPRKLVHFLSDNAKNLEAAKEGLSGEDGIYLGAAFDALKGIL